jgi:peptidyl-prolyl cis-trans isomerase A (cyclophilin A)
MWPDGLPRAEQLSMTRRRQSGGGAWLCCAALLGACQITNPADPGKRAPVRAEAPLLPELETVEVARTQGPVQGPGELEPDAAETATRPPVAADLARYTADLVRSGALIMELDTSVGALRCELYEDKAPLTVANFVGLARGLKAWTHPNSSEPRVGQPFYDGLIFHRIVPKFMIQGGDPLGIGSGGPGYEIPDEAGGKALKHDRGGLLSMANRGPNTGGSQFFITEVAKPFLDGKHVIFGACSDVDFVQKIANMPRNPLDRPEEPPVIKAIRFSRASAR